MQNEVDARPLHFLRLSFGMLMAVYSASKCSDDLGNGAVLDHFRYGFEQRIPTWMYRAAESFPWFTDSYLYWHIHAPLMLLSAMGMAFSFGLLSRFSCLMFALLKFALTLRDQTIYNNHEHLYAFIALLLGLLDAHHPCYSFLGRAVIQDQSLALTQKNQKKAKSEHSNMIGAWTCLFLSMSGCGYMMINNALYGIAGYIAVAGMCLGVWPGIVLLLGRSRKTEAGGEIEVEDSDTYTEDEEVTATYTVPSWQYTVLQVFFGAMYFFAGMAKMDHDWLSGLTTIELFRLWTGPTINGALRQSILQVGVGLGTAYEELLVDSIVYGGLLLDISAPFAFYFGNSAVRVLFTVFVGTFHFFNHWSFVIETFPWVMMSSLCIYHDSQWMDSFHQAIFGVFSMIKLKAKVAYVSNLLRLLVFPIIAVLLILHLFIPLPCAIYTVGDDGSLAWSSRCQFFRWKMMTRSVKTLTTQLRFQNPSTGLMDVVPMTTRSLYPDIESVRECTAKFSYLEKYGYESDKRANKFLQDASSFEDRLDWVVQDAKQRVVSTTADHTDHTDHTIAANQVKSPRIYADIWVEINGPPFQRYVDPTVDLASVETENKAKSDYSLFSISASTATNPLRPWVMPRLVAFRSYEWIKQYRKLHASVIESHIQCEHASLNAFNALKDIKGTSRTNTISSCDPDPSHICHEHHEQTNNVLKPPQVLFLADVPNMAYLTLESPLHNKRAQYELQLLSGKAEILNINLHQDANKGQSKDTNDGVIEENSCLRIQGRVVLKTLSDEPSLWMLVLDSEAAAEGTGIYDLMRGSNIGGDLIGSEPGQLIVAGPGHMKGAGAETRNSEFIKHCVQMD